MKATPAADTGSDVFTCLIRTIWQTIRAILTADIQGKQCSFMRSLLDKDLWLMQFGYKPSNTGGVVDE